MRNKKFIVVAIIIGVLLVTLGVVLKITTNGTKQPEKSVVNVKEAITGEVGYYEENDKVVIVYEARNNSEEDVTIKKVIFSLEDITTDNEVYRKEFNVSEVIKGGTKKEIILKDIEASVTDLQENIMTVKVE